MALLSIDTSSRNCSVHLKRSDGVCFGRTNAIGRGHAEVLIDMIDEALGQLDLSYQDLTRIGVTTGPGSFTGVRVGLSAARGLALALDIPVVGVSTLEALASGCDMTSAKLVVQDAKRGEFYTQFFDENGASKEGPLLHKIDAPCPELWLNYAGLALIGSGAQHFASLIKGAFIHSTDDAPSIEIVAKLCEVANVSDIKPKPLYLRAADAKPQPLSARVARLVS
ncbi:MAG: tRNA (adenosine(37)-N6)-threonylcarbamoyltransferase complex dimerization subunit type 1 TsaB [Hyphomicrobiales bacterium]